VTASLPPVSPGDLDTPEAVIGLHQASDAEVAAAAAARAPVHATGPLAVPSVAGSPYWREVSGQA